MIDVYQQRRAFRLRKLAEKTAALADEFRSQGQDELASEYESQEKLCNEEASELEREIGVEHETKTHTG